MSASWAHSVRSRTSLASAFPLSRSCYAVIAPLAKWPPNRMPAVSDYAWTRPPRPRSVGRYTTSRMRPWRSCARGWRKRLASASACRPCAGWCGAWGYHVKNVTPCERARYRAGPARAGGLPGTDPAARSPALQVCRRVGRQLGHDASVRPRAPGGNVSWGPCHKTMAPTSP
jgi:hypothetical protein